MQREERRIVAEKHTKEMEKKFHKEILHSAQNARFYDGEVASVSSGKRNIGRTGCMSLRHVVKNQDVGTAIAENKMEHPDEKTAVLNFASYKEPGGRFIDGCMAQEEALCHASALYNVLKCSYSCYEWNRQHLNRALYLNRGIYSPEVPFVFGGTMVKCDVITVAAPNKNAAQKYCKVTDEENSLVLRGRVRFVLDIAEANQVDTLILGAYGCGVFGQDPKEVAEIFLELLESGKYGFRKVVFPIPAGKDGNLAAFQEVFNEGKRESRKSGDLISRKMLIEKLQNFCGTQRYLIPETVWNIIENVPASEKADIQNMGVQEKKADKTEFIGQVIDLFEDFLEEKGVSLNNGEKDEPSATGEEPEQETIIYGSDYDQLQAGIEALLENWGLVNARPKSEKTEE